MNHHKLIPAAPAALLFAGAFSAFSSATTKLPSPAGAARALDHHQNTPISLTGPRATEGVDLTIFTEPIVVVVASEETSDADEEPMMVC